MQNLRDKLMKAGLVTEDQVKKTESQSEKRKERPPGPPAEREGTSRDAAGPPGERPNREPPRGERPQGFRDGGRRGGGNDSAERRFERPAERPSGGGPRSVERPSSGGGPRPSGGRPVSSGARPPPRGAPLEEVRIPKLPPLPGSKAAQRMESRKQLETDKQLRELVHAHQVPLEAGERTFYFVTRKNRLRRMEVSEAQARLLETGKLAVVERPEPAQIEHSLVPPEVAEQMLALSAKAVRFLNRDQAPVGFISDEELKTRQEAEKHAAPEEDAPQAEADSEGTEASTKAPGASGTPSSSMASTASEEARSAEESSAEAPKPPSGDTPSGDTPVS